MLFFFWIICIFGIFFSIYRFIYPFLNTFGFIVYKFDVRVVGAVRDTVSDKVFFLPPVVVLQARLVIGFTYTDLDSTISSKKQYKVKPLGNNNRRDCAASRIRHYTRLDHTGLTLRIDELPSFVWQ